MERRINNSNGYHQEKKKKKKNHIDHPVSRFDTLAGIAIKYGVEVADIKKMNGLSTDLQMFALKTLQIPLPGRHPPSTCLSNGTENPRQTTNGQTSQHHEQRDPFHSFQSLRLKSSPQRKVSPAMSSLQGYYGLKPTDQRPPADERKGETRYLEDCPVLCSSPSSNLPLDSNRKSRSLANFFLAENGEIVDNINFVNSIESETNKWNEKPVRRRQKTEAEFSSGTPETLLKEDNSGGVGFQAMRGKGLAQRPKAANRTTTVADAEGVLNPVPLMVGDSLPSDLFSRVRKSSSASNLQDQEESCSSVWPSSKWSLKPDLQALSIAKPIFDGFSKPMSGRRNKAALD